MKASGQDERASKRILHRFLIIFFVVGVILVGSLVLLYQSDRDSQLAELKNQERYALEFQAMGIEKDLGSVANDIFFIAQQNELLDMLDNHDNNSRDELENELLIFSKTKKIFDQIRFINSDGTECIRINFNNGAPQISAHKNLQNKGQRYYFKDSIALNPGEIYVSQLDLNLENENIERPFKPMLRIATPVEDSQGNKRGVIILNYMAQRLLDRIVNTGGTPRDRKVLLNSEGYWLLSPDKKDEWGFMFESNQENTFAKRYPEVWRMMLATEQGQELTPNGLFTFTTVYPQKLLGHSDAAKVIHTTHDNQKTVFWILLSHVPQVVMNEHAAHLKNKIFMFGALFLTILAVGAWKLSSSTVKRDIYQAQLFSMAMHDNLTGIPNRTMFFDRLHTGLELSNRYKRKLGLLYIDLDGFKKVNDSLGHEAGDELLVEAAKRIGQCVRKSDTVARLGGDEFAAVLQEITGDDGALKVGAKMVQALCAPFKLTAGEVTIGASIGAAVYPLHATTAEDLVKRADQAMYKAKTSGKNTCISA